MYEQVKVAKTVYGTGENRLICGDVMRLPREIREMAGQVQCVYLDPPFMTGASFKRRRVYGEKGWRRGSPSLTLPSYEDKYPDEKAYLRMIRKMITASRDLLQEEGVFCLHLDWRMSAKAREICDRVFGRERFLNEIIWSYESGGRSRHFFPRKHDTILMYARSAEYRFDLSKVPLARGEHRKNHMARGMDEDGRTYSSIRSGNKEYRYYDDEPVYPGDVWTDIGFLQQRDPERTGFLTQKPMKLIDRLLRPVTAPGDRVADLCCGSGTTLAAAEKLGCRYIGLEKDPAAVAVSLARLKAEDLTVQCPTDPAPAELKAEYDPEAGRLRMGGLALQGEIFPEKVPPIDLLESWETGRIEGGVFYTQKRFQRSFQYPALVDSLGVPAGAMPDILTTDAAGIRRAYRWREE